MCWSNDDSDKAKAYHGDDTGEDEQVYAAILRAVYAQPLLVHYCLRQSTLCYSFVVPYIPGGADAGG